jgi:cell division protein FtsW
MPMQRWEKAAPWLFVGSLVLLVLVLIPGIGKVVNGARRWIPLGPMNFQPSELMPSSRGALCGRLHGAQDGGQGAVLQGRAADGAGGRLVGVLLLLEPDLGAFIVIAVIAMGILFLGGVKRACSS